MEWGKFNVKDFESPANHIHHGGDTHLQQNWNTPE